MGPRFSVIVPVYKVDVHPFIRVIHKPNGGLSSAHNTGLETARGSVTFSGRTA